MKHLKQAFTLVELIVVISILAILATVAFISFSGYTSDAKNTNNKANIRTIEGALQIYHTKNNSYPEATDAFNITSSGSIYATQGTMGRKTLGLLGVSQDTVDANTNQAYIYSLSANNQKYGIVSFQNSLNSLIMGVYANDFSKQYEGNGAPIILTENNQNISGDIDVLTVPDNYEVYFDNNSYGEDSNKLLKYYYHPNAISVVNFNDDNFDDILGNITTTNKKPSITQGKVGNGMLVNGDGGGLQVHINPNKFTNKLTMSAWVKQKSYNLEDTYDVASACGDNGIIMRFNEGGAYMVSDYQGTLCGYHYRYTPRGYHNSTYTIQLETWTHIAQVWNGSDLKFYVNGQQVGSTIDTQYGETYINTHGKAKSYLIGIEAMDNNVGGLRRYFDGVIDEVSMYNTDLSGAEVLELYNITK